MALRRVTSILRSFPTSSQSLNHTSVRLNHTSAASEAFRQHIGSELQSIRSAGTFKNERVITSQQQSHINVSTSSKPVINMCANNYLGLANNETLMQAAKKTIDSHGFGLSSVRFICGTQDIHKQLEQEIAKFHGTEDCILFPSAFDANAGIFEALLGPEDAIISDTLNHASIIDGIRLSKAKRYRYEHLSLSDLEAKLVETSTNSRHRLIVTDGVFSMDGHIAPLKEIVALAEKYKALVFIDEAHATGFFGKTGRGTPEYCGVEGKIDIINSTLGKALGGATGGYTASTKEIVGLLRQRARPYLFSNTVAPSVVGASLEVFRMLSSSTRLRDKLAANTQLFRSLMQEHKFDMGGSADHPIVPIMLYDARLASQFADEMLKQGVYVIGFSFPVVPKDKARIRVQVSAAHSEEDIRFAVNAFVKVRDMLTKK